MGGIFICARLCAEYVLNLRVLLMAWLEINDRFVNSPET